MLIQTRKPNLLIGATCHPLDALVEVSDEVGRRLVKAGAADLVVTLDAETAAMPEAPETADATPRRRKKAEV